MYTRSEWDVSEEPTDCSIELKVLRPNWYCAEREELLKKLYVPLIQLDTEGTISCIQSKTSKFTFSVTSSVALLG